MKLALNTSIYAATGAKPEDRVRSIGRLGFRFVEWVACGLGDPDGMSRGVKRDLAAMFDDGGLYCAQMLLTNMGHLASSDARKRKDTLEHMKRVAGFQLELGGKQVLVGGGCGALESGVVPERSWLRMVESLEEFADWSLDKGILVEIDLGSQVFLLVNTTEKMAKVVEDVGMPNLFCNVDVGHLAFARESPAGLEKLRGKILQVHFGETDQYSLTSGILGSGVADFKVWADKVREIGIEENCIRCAEPCVAGIEMADPLGRVDDPERWVKESLENLARILPGLER